jgi:hypothetical protein
MAVVDEERVKTHPLCACMQPRDRESDAVVV